jgi:hypothetical protein
MKITCDNGLCDRLRFIFSYFFENKKLTVCWKMNKKCNGHFLDIFQPIKNLEFTENEENIDVSGWEPYSDIEKSQNIYKYLFLIPELNQEINKLRLKMNNYISIHIRRTDKLLRHKNLTKDDDFIKFAKKTKHNIFLATDCYYVQNKFKEIFKNRLFYFDEIKKPWNYTLDDCQTYGTICPDFRPKSLRATAIDIFTCIYSNNFMGTNLSGMSDFIYYNRRQIASKKFI